MPGLYCYLTFVLIMVEVRGHGRMLEPPSRASMWRRGFATPTNYNDNQLFCGGFYRQWSINGGKCGVCGDPWNGPREHEAGGKYATGLITKSYTEGATINVELQITASHLGFFEFRLCPNNNPKKAVTQDCLDQHLLHQPDGQTRVTEVGRAKTYQIQLVLPAEVTCSQCLLQWKWNTGNSYGCDAKGCCKGCGPQEQFYGCSDISVKPKGALDENGSQHGGHLTGDSHHIPTHPIESHNGPGQGQTQPYIPAGQGQHQPDIPAGQGQPQPHIPAGQGQHQPYIPAGQGQLQPHIPAGQGQHQPYIPAGQGQPQPHIPAGQGQHQPYIPSSQGHHQPYIPAIQGQPQPHIPASQVQSQPHIPGGQGQSPVIPANQIPSQSQVHGFYGFIPINFGGNAQTQHQVFPVHQVPLHSQAPSHGQQQPGVHKPIIPAVQLFLPNPAGNPPVQRPSGFVPNIGVQPQTNPFRPSSSQSHQTPQFPQGQTSQSGITQGVQHPAIGHPPIPQLPDPAHNIYNHQPPSNVPHGVPPIQDKPLPNHVVASAGSENSHPPCKATPAYKAVYPLADQYCIVRCTQGLCPPSRYCLDSCRH